MRRLVPFAVLAFLVPAAAAAFADSGEIVIECKVAHVSGIRLDCFGSKSWDNPGDPSGVYRATLSWTPVDPAYEILSARLLTVTVRGPVIFEDSETVTGRSPLTVAIPVDGAPDSISIELDPSSERLGNLRTTEVVVLAPDQPVSYTLVNEP